jgi:hypothetical protein
VIAPVFIAPVKFKLPAAVNLICSVVVPADVLQKDKSVISPLLLSVLILHAEEYQLKESSLLYGSPGKDILILSDSLPPFTNNLVLLSEFSPEYELGFPIRIPVPSSVI